MVKEPIGTASNGEPVYLKDIWPSNEEIRSLIDAHVHSAMFRRRYADVYRGDERWQKIEIKGGETYGWPAASTYIQNPPYFTGMSTTRVINVDSIGKMLELTCSPRVRTVAPARNSIIFPNGSISSRASGENVARRRLPEKAASA